MLLRPAKTFGSLLDRSRVVRNIRNRDLQMASVILDFRKLEVVKATLNGVVVPKDFNKIVEYYYQHYKSTLDRLFAENGWQVETVSNEQQNEPEQTNAD